MYNRAENVIGDIIDAAKNRDKLFLASKVWTNGKAAGARQMSESAERMNAGVIDLMQVHNLRDTNEHLATIRDWQAEGRIRYNGVTHYHAGAMDELEAAMKKHKPNFIQINYSVVEREADKRVLPLAMGPGDRSAHQSAHSCKAVCSVLSATCPLPDWAGEFAESWGQLFLKFIIGHPAVSCVIPATTKLHHMADNLGAGFGALPDDSARQRIVDCFDAL